jgi:hypothetical protein
MDSWFKFKIRKRLTDHEVTKGRVMVYMAMFICASSFCADWYVQAQGEEDSNVGTFTYGGNDYGMRQIVEYPRGRIVYFGNEDTGICTR